MGLLLVTKRDRRLAFHPAAGPVGNQLDEFDAVFGDRRDTAVVLSEIVVFMYAVHDAFRVFHESFDRIADAERADHRQTVERILLEQLRRAVAVGAFAVAGRGELLLAALFGARAERIA